MKRMLMAIMAVVVAISFSAPAFSDDTKPAPKPAEEKKKQGGGHMIYADPDKKEEKKKPDTKK